MFVAICWSYGKWSVSIVPSIAPLVDHFVVKVWILTLPHIYLPTPPHGQDVAQILYPHISTEGKSEI